MFDETEKFNLKSLQLKPLKLSATYNQLMESLDEKISEPGDNSFDSLPLEIKLQILNYLAVRELCGAASVSKHWESLTSLNCLWKKFLPASTQQEFTSFLTAKTIFALRKKSHIKWLNIGLGDFKDINNSVSNKLSSEIRDEEADRSSDYASLVKPMIGPEKRNFENTKDINIPELATPNIIEGNDPDPSKRFIMAFK